MFLFFIGVCVLCEIIRFLLVTASISGVEQLGIYVWGIEYML